MGTVIMPDDILERFKNSVRDLLISERQCRRRYALCGVRRGHPHHWQCWRELLMTGSGIRRRHEAQDHQSILVHDHEIQICSPDGLCNKMGLRVCVSLQNQQVYAQNRYCDQGIVAESSSSSVLFSFAIVVWLSVWKVVKRFVNLAFIGSIVLYVFTQQMDTHIHVFRRAERYKIHYTFDRKSNLIIVNNCFCKYKNSDT